jgi:hypothetical protein
MQKEDHQQAYANMYSHWAIIHNERWQYAEIQMQWLALMKTEFHNKNPMYTDI